MLKFLQAGYPALYCTTIEHRRAIQSFCKEVGEINNYYKENNIEEQPYQVFMWDMVDGLRNAETYEKVVTKVLGPDGREIPPANPVYPLYFLATISKNVVMFLPNYHYYLQGQSSPMVSQTIYNLHIDWKMNGKTILVLAPSYNVPPEIDRIFQLIDFSLPTDEEIKVIMENVIPDDFINPDYDPADEKSKQFTIDITGEAIRAAKGMTALEIENAFSLSIAEVQRFDPIIISEIKKQQVKKSATLDISIAKHKFEDVVGLENLKEYTLKTAMNPMAQGILFVGPAGSGKTYFSEALANELGVYGVTLSFDKIMAAGKALVGQAQAQALEAFNVIDSLAPCVVLIDEISKGLSGIQSSGRTDSGTKAGVGGIFLKWIEKKTPGVYIIATENNIEDLPPEYKRSGRWDSIWGADLPTQQEAYHNLEYYTKRFGVEHRMDELDSSEDVKKFMDSLAGKYSHAELMTIVKHSFMLDISIRDALKYVKPIIEVDPITVKSIREFVSKNAIPAGASYYGTPLALRPKTDKELIGKRKFIIKKPGNGGKK